MPACAAMPPCTGFIVYPWNTPSPLEIARMYPATPRTLAICDGPKPRRLPTAAAAPIAPMVPVAWKPSCQCDGCMATPTRAPTS